MRAHGHWAVRAGKRFSAAFAAVAVVTAGAITAAAPSAGAAVHALVATTTTSLDTGSPVIKGNPVTLTASVDCGATVPTGTVTFSQNGVGSPLGSAPLDGTGVATLDATSLITAVGTYTLHASYGGDAACAASQSPDATLEIDPSTTSLFTGNFRTLGFPIRIEADVNCGASIATGSVTFFENGVATPLGTVPLDETGGAVLDLTNSITTPSDHVFHATYSGDSACTPSTSIDKSLIVLPNDPIQRYVDFVYEYLFGRTADPAGLQYWVALIRGGVDRSALAWALVTSEEHRGKVIDDTFEKYLGRPVDASGKAFFLARTGSGLSFLDIDLFIVGSDEYYANAGGTNTAFLNVAYGDLLNRAPDPSGLAYGLVTLGNGTPRSRFAGGLVFSDEYLGRVIDGLYLGVFGRHVDPAGRAYWTTQVQSGMPIQVLVALLVGSSELFFNLTGIRA